jgi:hypothetical protein
MFTFSELPSKSLGLYHMKMRGSIGLHHPLDGVTNPEYKLLHFIQLTNFFAKRRWHWLLTGLGAAIQRSVYG